MNIRIIIVALAVGAVSAPAIAQEKPAVQDVIDRFTKSWDAADAKAIGALFGADADLVTPDGLVVSGRDDIVRYYSAAFASGYAGSHGTGEILQERTIGPGLELLDGRFSIRRGHDGNGAAQRPQSGMVSIILRDRGTGWQIIAWRERNGSVFTRFTAPPGR